MFGAWFATLGVIAWASLSPSHASAGDPAQAPSWLTNVGHVPAYALLTVVTLWFAQGRARSAALAVAAAFGIGALFEVVQPLVGRDGNVVDLSLNALGISLALIVWSHGWLPKLLMNSR